MDEHWEWSITFTLAAGYDEADAYELFEQIERSPRVSGAALIAEAREAASSEESP